MNISKRRIFIAILLSMFSVNTFASQFCDGFSQGYITGYKQANNTSLTPLVPLCPLKPLKGFGDPQSDYEFGYTVGFRDAMAGGR